jgi:hypothetical protein
MSQYRMFRKALQRSHLITGLLIILLGLPPVLMAEPPDLSFPDIEGKCRFNLCCFQINSPSGYYRACPMRSLSHLNILTDRIGRCVPGSELDSTGSRFRSRRLYPYH